MQLLYNLFVRLYYLAILLSSVRNKKARLWLHGRKQWFDRLKKSLNREEDIIWVHCASLGEFEQGRPVMEALRDKYPEYKILLTFFSPSGYEIRKNYQGADYVFYLPLDTSHNARRFIRIVQPKLVLFVKYEFWFNFIKEIKKNNIPLLSISSFFRPNQHFFTWYGAWFRKQLKYFTWFYVQNKESLGLLNRIGIYHVTISGDTRFDRVLKISEAAGKFPLIEQFKKEKSVFLAGSSWPPEEKIIQELIHSDFPNLIYIIAPHDISESHINGIIQMFGNDAVRYSQADTDNIGRYKILIIDSIGILNQLYQYAKYAFVGGGFGPGIHNILEAAAFGIPVFFGPNYGRFREAVELIRLKAGFEIRQSQDLISWVDAFEKDTGFYESTARISGDYVKDNQGATPLILSDCDKYLI